MVPAPLRDVAEQVMKAKRIGSEGPDRRVHRVTVVPGVVFGARRSPDVVEELIREVRRLGETVRPNPGPSRRRRFTPSPVLPLRLRRNDQTEPAEPDFAVFPAHLLDRISKVHDLLADVVSGWVLARVLSHEP